MKLSLEQNKRIYLLQCKPEWYNGKTRRSRIHKEYKALRAKWKDEEYEKWKKDWNDIRTIEWRNEFTLKELMWLTYPNAVWWLETIIGKWWSMFEMNKIPFLMMFSWVAYGFEQKTIDTLKNFPCESKMLPMLRFIWQLSDIDLVNETIVALSKRLWEIKGDKWMYNDALEIFSNQKSTSLPDPEKISKTEKFYDKYWEVLTDALYSLNTRKTDEYSWTSKIIRLEKDTHLDDDGKEVSGNTTFKKYYDLMGIYKDQFSFKDDEKFSDPFKKAWTSGINMHYVAAQVLQQDQWWGYRMSKSWPSMWDEISDEINAIVKRDYWSKGTKNWVNNSRKKQDLEYLLKWLITWLLEAHGSRLDILEKVINDNTSVMGNHLRSWGLNFNDILNFSYKNIIDWWADTIISGYADTLITGKWWITSKISSAISWTQQATDNAFDGE